MTMRIGILSRAPRCYSTRRLREAAQQRGHKVRVLDTLGFMLSVAHQHPELHYGGKDLAPFDAVIPRIGSSVTFFGCSVVRQFEQMGVFTLNSSHAITTARDKLRTMQTLSRHDIGIPPSAFVRNRSDVLPAIERVGGVPVIIKLLEGTQGVGVILAETLKVAEAIIETLQTARQNVLIQKFVSESRGRDIRAVVVGERVVAAMRRRAVGSEFRSNVHRGGKTEAITLDAGYEKTAVRAAHIIGLRVAGVDMLEGRDGPQVMEVNSSPGLEGIEKTTGIDIAGALIQHIEEQSLFPEMDYRQRLTLNRGYGVVEFVIESDSSLVGQTIEQSRLREQDIVVLSINRQDVLIPNPRATRELMSGDQLICYGKLVTLKTLIPKVSRTRRKSGQRRSKAAL